MPVHTPIGEGPRDTGMWRELKQQAQFRWMRMKFEVCASSGPRSFHAKTKRERTRPLNKGEVGG